MYSKYLYYPSNINLLKLINNHIYIAEENIFALYKENKFFILHSFSSKILNFILLEKNLIGLSTETGMYILDGMKILLKRNFAPMKYLSYNNSIFTMSDGKILFQYCVEFQYGKFFSLKNKQALNNDILFANESILIDRNSIKGIFQFPAEIDFFYLVNDEILIFAKGKFYHFIAGQLRKKIRFLYEKIVFSSKFFSVSRENKIIFFSYEMEEIDEFELQEPIDRLFASTEGRIFIQSGNWLYENRKRVYFLNREFNLYNLSVKNEIAIDRVVFHKIYRNRVYLLSDDNRLIIIKNNFIKTVQLSSQYELADVGDFIIVIHDGLKILNMENGKVVKEIGFDHSILKVYTDRLYLYILFANMEVYLLDLKRNEEIYLNGNCTDICFDGNYLYLLRRSELIRYNGSQFMNTINVGGENISVYNNLYLIDGKLYRNNILLDSFPANAVFFNGDILCNNILFKNQINFNLKKNNENNATKLIEYRKNNQYKKAFILSISIGKIEGVVDWILGEGIEIAPFFADLGEEQQKKFTSFLIENIEKYAYVFNKISSQIEISEEQIRDLKRRIF